MLHVEDLQKTFEGFRAVDGANLHVGKGELVAVIGPNGAGKTTLFNMITGQLKPDKGKIIFKNEDISRLSTYQICNRGIGRSFQITNIFPSLTVFRNVQVSVLSKQKRSFGLFHSAQRIAVEETNNILESVGLVDKASGIAGSLSYGDQRVLEYAIALGIDPELLILDEPTAGMSPEETIATMELIKKLASDRGLTILFCEHDMDVVFNIAESIMVMHQGLTIIQGRPEEVKDSHKVQECYLGGYG